jgi:transposase
LIIDHQIYILELPSQYPDLNPIENPWFELKRAVDRSRQKDVKDLEIFCMEKLSKIPPNVLQYDIVLLSH